MICSRSPWKLPNCKDSIRAVFIGCGKINLRLLKGVMKMMKSFDNRFGHDFAKAISRTEEGSGLYLVQMTLYITGYVIHSLAGVA